MAHRDLGQYYRSVGEYTIAIKHYTKSREFCTTSQHVLDMCLSMLEVITVLLSLQYRHSNSSCFQIFIEQKSYAHITTYVFKAEAALDATAASAASSNQAPAGPTGAAAAAAAKKASTEEREKIQAKLEFANAISYLGGSNYDKAAYHFLRIGPPQGLGDWLGKVRTLTPVSSPIYLMTHHSAHCAGRYCHLWHSLCSGQLFSNCDQITAP